MDDWGKIGLAVIATMLVVFNKHLAQAAFQRASWIPVRVLRVYYVIGGVLVILAVFKSLFWP